MVIEKLNFWGLLNVIPHNIITEDGKYFCIAIAYSQLENFDKEFQEKFRNDFLDIISKYGKLDEGAKERTTEEAFKRFLDIHLSFNSPTIIKFDISKKDIVQEILNKYYSTVYIMELRVFDDHHYWEENT